jgi:hypothetical protein
MKFYNESVNYINLATNCQIIIQIWNLNLGNWFFNSEFFLQVMNIQNNKQNFVNVMEQY